MPRPDGATPPEIFQKHVHANFALVERCVESDPQTRDDRVVVGSARIERERRQSDFSSSHLGGKQLALSHQTFNCEDEVVVAFPSCLREKRSAILKIAQRRSVRGGGLGALRGDEVQLRCLLAFRWRVHKFAAAIQLADDLEYHLLELLCRSASLEQSAD